MTRDYKKHGGKKKQVGSEWLWFVGGLAVGLIVTVVVFVKDQSTIKSLRSELNALPTITQVSEPKATDEVMSKAADDSELEPRFTFYEELPKFEVTVPATSKSTDLEAGQADSIANIDINDIQAAYLLQAGSFQSLAEAEQLKAELALLGLRANIESAIAQDQQTWYRVRLGPYSSLPEAHDAQAMLMDQALDTLIMQLPTQP
ncbi:MAG: SPOR domain-containing protein [Gammaproteobacteria bacterium]|nr:SPOR domain-containing protein [Gammaproteobacteria bacterium]